MVIAVRVFVEAAANCRGQGSRGGRFSRFAACGLLVCFILLGAGCQTLEQPGALPRTGDDVVGQVGPNRHFTPVNQLLTPAGIQVELPGMRPQALALSPDGRLLVTAGKTHELVVLDPRTGRILQHVPLPSERERDPSPQPVSGHILEPDADGQLSYTGLTFSPNGSRIYLANVPRTRVRQ